jgi:hypothetical protein
MIFFFITSSVDCDDFDLGSRSRIRHYYSKEEEKGWKAADWIERFLLAAAKQGPLDRE